MSSRISDSPEISGERPNVGAATARYYGRQRLRSKLLYVPAVHRHIRRCQRERLPSARSVVGTGAVDAFRRISGRHLGDFARERCYRLTDCRLTRTRSAPDYGSGLVVRVGLGSESNQRFVNLRLSVEEGSEASRATEQQDQQSSRKRIEGAQMSDASLPVDTPYVLDDIMRRHPSRLVDEEQSLSWRSLGGVVSPCCRLVHASRRSPAS